MRTATIALMLGILGGCASDEVPTLSPAHHLATAHELAAVCRDPSVPSASAAKATHPNARPTMVAPATLNDALTQRGHQPRCGTRQTVTTAIETGSIPDPGPLTMPPIAVARAATALEQAPASRQQDGARPRLYLRFAPSSIKLSATDRDALGTFLATPSDASSRHVRVTMSPGGAGNAFDQLVVANNRIAEINGLLGASVIATAAFDPSLPDDVAHVEID